MYAPLRNIPHTDGAIFTVGYDQFVFWVKEHTRYIICVSSHRVHLPRLYIQILDVCSLKKLEEKISSVFMMSVFH